MSGWVDGRVGGWMGGGGVGGMTQGTLGLFRSVFPMKGCFQRHQDPAVFRRGAVSVPWESPRVSGLVDWGPLGAWPSYRVRERTQLCPTLCDPLDSSSPGFSVHGMFQARILE